MDNLTIIDMTYNKGVNDAISAIKNHFDNLSTCGELDTMPISEFNSILNSIQDELLCKEQI